ncbi:SDR family NAD(P)-dependent oxidoreductase [Altericista sp. CCNU0014]|uniref:SDR family NAD(P)-dependent oxidoreductase n=1 Tax=Altericista sp. CCNU0014 TaxID=3082949 RepID=UPI00384A7DE5
MTSTFNIEPSSVFLASGGARGITAQCAIRLAQDYGGRWILLGRSEIADSEPDWAAGCFDEAELKKRILEHFRAQGLKPTPKEIQSKFKAISSRREILNTLREIEAVGGQAEYLSADVTDLECLRARVAAVIHRWGPISGILHGAGNLADKAIEKKTVEDFETVYAAKVQGLENLLQCVPAEQLNYLVLFSSVAGFYGNAGQTDYAIANEILNKSAHRLKGQHPNCHVVAINWGPWDSGMVTPELKKIYAEHNVEVIPVAAGTQLLFQELSGHNCDIAQVVIGNPLPCPQRAPEPELQTYRIRRHLTLADNPFLFDHEIAGYPVLPATCAMAWMINACEQRYPSYRFFSCKNFKILKGIPFDQTLADEYILDLKEIAKTDTQFIEFEAKIWSKTTAGKTHYHYTSQIQLLKQGLVAPTETLYEQLHSPLHSPPQPPNSGGRSTRDVGFLPPELGGWGGQCNVFNTDEGLNLTPDRLLEIPIESFYRTGDSGLFHGPAFQGIDRIIHIDLEGITAQATWKSLAEREQGQFPIQTVNPYIVDLSMHPLWVWTQHFHQKACLPAEVGQYEQFAEIPTDNPFFVTTKIKALTETSATVNLTIHDGKSLIYARMTGAKATLIKMNLLRQKQS